MVKATNEYHLRFLADGDFSNLTKEIKGIKNSLEKIDFGDTKLKKSLEGILNSLDNELDSFSVKASKELNSIGDITGLQKSEQKITDLFSKLEIKLGQIDKNKIKNILSDSALKELETLQKNLSEAENNLIKVKNSFDSVAASIEAMSFSKGIQKDIKNISDLVKKGKDTTQVVDELRKKINSDSYVGDSDAIRTEQVYIKKLITHNKDLNNEIEKQKNLVNEASSSSNHQKSSKEIDEEIKAIEEQIKAYRKLYIEQNNGSDRGYTKGFITSENGEKLYFSQLKEKENELKSLKNQQEEYEQLITQLQNLRTQLEQNKKALEAAEEEYNKLNNASRETDLSKLDEAQKRIKDLEQQCEESEKAVKENAEAFNNFNTQKLKEGQEAFENLNQNAGKVPQSLENISDEISNLADEAAKIKSVGDEIEDVYQRALQFFSLENAVDLFKRSVEKAFEAVKELDAEMTEIAVVTDFEVGDVWETLPEYTDMANKIGSTIAGVYEVAKLYYQQGLDQQEVMEATEATLQMARVGNIDYAKSTDYMTAAIRGFKLEMKDATRINDVFSKLAAITAADTIEIAEALTRTASIANSAGMKLETTSAFLAQMIEITRESPENLGTALKTIIARFQEMKTAPGDIEVDGEIVNVNKVEAALRTARVALRDANGQFRDLDDVFIELSSKWPWLDKNTQRYIATIAAGSRQQSRFIAMMDNYDRTIELVGAAYNSAGAGQEQYEKTTDSLESKLNNLKNAWDEFTTGITNSDLIKGGVDLLTNILTIVNNLTDNFGDLGNSVAKIGVLLGGISIGGAVLEKAGNSFIGAIVSQLTGKGGSSLNKTGKFLGTQIIEDINAGLYKGKNVFIKTLGSQIDGSIDNLKGKFSSFGTAFHSLLFGGDFEISDQSKGLGKIIERYEEASKKWHEASDLSARQRVDLGLTKNYVNSRKALLSTELKSIGYLKLEKSEQGIYNALLKEGISLSQINNLMKDDGAKAALKQAQVTGQLNAETAKKIAQDKGLLQESVLSRSKTYIQLLFGTSKATREAAAQSLGLGKAVVGTSGSMAKLSAVLTGVSVGWVALAAAVVAAGVAVVAYTAYTSTLEYQIKQADKAIEAAQENAEGLKTAYEELLSVQTSYNDTRENIEGLTEGTKEWKDAITDANKATLEMVGNYGELAKGLSKNKNGLLTIDDAAFDDLLKDAEKVSSNAQSRVFVAQINKAQLEQKKQTQDSNKELEKILKEFQRDSVVNLPETNTLGVSSLEAVEGILENWDNFSEEYSNFYNEEDLTKLKTELISATESYSSEMYTSSKELEGSFSALTESLGIAVDGVDNFAASVSNVDIEHPSGDFAGNINSSIWGNWAGHIFGGALYSPLSRLVTGDLRDFAIDMADIAPDWLKNLSSVEQIESTLNLTKLANDWGIDIKGAYFNTDISERLYAALTNSTEDDVEQLIKANELTYDQIAQVIAQEYSRSEYEEKIRAIANELSKTNSETANFIADAMSGNAAELLDKTNYNILREFTNFDDLDSNPINVDKFKNYLNANGLELESVAAAYGKTQEELISFFGDLAKQFKSIYRNEAKQLLITLNSTGGIANNTTTDQISGMLGDIGIEGIAELNDLLENLQAGLGEGTEIFNAAANNLLMLYRDGAEEEIAAVKSFVQGIDWSSSIDSAIQLKQAIKSNNDSVKAFATYLYTVNEEMYSMSSQFEEFFTSEGYSEIVEDIEKLIEKNGEITGDDVEELVGSCEELDKILEQNIVSVDTLADALTKLNTGEISIEGLTNRAWEFLDSLNSVDNVVKKVHSDIENFDEGIDTGEGMDFLAERSEAIQEYINNLEFGNDQVMGSLEYIFGKDVFDGLSGDDLIEQIKEKANTLKEWVAGDGYGFWEDVANGVINISGIKASLDSDKNVVLDIADMTTDEVVKALMGDNERTEEAARMLLTNYVSHSADIRQTLKENDLNAAIESLFSTENSYQGLNNLWVYSEEEFKVMASAAGQSYNDFLAKAQSYNDSIRIADWFTDEGIEKTGEALKEEIDKVYDGLTDKSAVAQLNYLGVEKSFNGRELKVDLDELIAKYQELGLSIEQAEESADALATKAAAENYDFYFTADYQKLEDGNYVAGEVAKKTVQEVRQGLEDEETKAAAEHFANTVADSFVTAFMAGFSGEEDTNLEVKPFIDQEKANTIIEDGLAEGQKVADANPIEIQTKIEDTAWKQFVKEITTKGRLTTTVEVLVARTESTTTSTRPVTSQEQAMKLSGVSYASGTSGVKKSGPALTGEEGYEIAYNNGGAFVLGNNGPEIVDLEKGTQIFNHEQSKKIVRRSKTKGFGGSYAKGTTPSYANVTGKWNDEKKNEAAEAKKNSSNSSSSSSSSKQDDPYESALDVYYNFISKLKKLNNDLDDLVNERDKILDREARALEAGDVRGVVAAQQELAQINDKILAQQKDIVKENSDYISGLKYGLDVLEDKIGQYGAIIDTSNGYMKIQWSSYNALGDEAKETVDDLISEWEDYYDRLEEAKDAIQETIDYYHDLAEEYRDSHNDARKTFIDLIKDLTDVLIQIDEEALERQQKYYDQLIEQDKNYLDALRENVEERRRIRDRENSYEDLAEKQRRLSLLKRDSSGVYANEIASLEKEIANSQQDITDQKIDDIIDNMDEELSLRQEQFDRHIELMEDAIEQGKKNGEYAQKAQELLENQPDEAYRILTEANSEYHSMSSAEQTQYVEEIKNQMIEMNRFMEGYYIRLAESMDAIADSIKNDLASALAALGQNSSNFNGSQIGADAGPSSSSSSSSGSSSSSSSSSLSSSSINDKNGDGIDDKVTIKSVQRAINTIIDMYNSSMAATGIGINDKDTLKKLQKEHIAVDGVTGPKTRSMALSMYNWATSKGVSARETRLIINNRDLIGFKEGGVVDFTGPAMVHGSKSKPETFLNAEDTKNVAKLRDALRELNISNKPIGDYGNSNFRAGDCTIYINIDQIANDYDVDKAIEEVQRKILSSSSYRNINLINRMR